MFKFRVIYYLDPFQFPFKLHRSGLRYKTDVILIKVIPVRTDDSYHVISLNCKSFNIPGAHKVLRTKIT